MKTLFVNEDTRNDVPCVATIGFFDGVHRGHRFLTDTVTAEARRTGMASMAITFDRHPRTVTGNGYKPQMLNTPYEKQELLVETGIDLSLIHTFTKETAALSAREFMKKILHDRLNVKTLITGYDNRFGHNRAEGFDDYVRYGAETSMEVRRAEAFVMNGVNVSSSVVRAFLSEGEVEMAARCLGYRYKIAGHVVNGMHQGRQMGFPTANIDVAGEGKMIPANGVYAVTVSIEGVAGIFAGMMNIGTRPTFGGGDVSLEVNIFGFSGDIYGRKVEVEFVKRIRGERRFASAEKLQEQLEDDRRKVMELNL